MLTKRKKQNLIFLFLGLLLGMLVCCIVFYFNVLKGFMQDSVNSIQALRSQKDTVRVVNTYYYPNAREANRESLPDSTKSDEDSLSLEESEDIILTDRMLASASIAVMRMLDDSTNKHSKSIWLQEYSGCLASHCQEVRREIIPQRQKILKVWTLKSGVKIYNYK